MLYLYCSSYLDKTRTSLVEVWSTEWSQIPTRWCHLELKAHHSSKLVNKYLLPESCLALRTELTYDVSLLIAIKNIYIIHILQLEYATIIVNTKLGFEFIKIYSPQPLDYTVQCTLHWNAMSSKINNNYHVYNSYRNIGCIIVQLKNFNNSLWLKVCGHW